MSEVFKPKEQELPPTCLRAVVELSLEPTDNPFTSMLVRQELNASTGFILRTPKGAFVRLDCRIPDCEASCGINDVAGIKVSPEVQAGGSWLPDCVEPDL